MKINNILIRKYNDTEGEIIRFKPKGLSIYFDYSTNQGEHFLVIYKYGISKLVIDNAIIHEIDTERILFSGYLSECINEYHSGEKVDIFCNFNI